MRWIGLFVLLLVACEWPVAPWYSQMVCPTEAWDSLAIWAPDVNAAKRWCAELNQHRGGSVAMTMFLRHRCLAHWQAADSILWVPQLDLDQCYPRYWPDGRRPGYPGGR